jgi:TPR repeat protein
MRTSIDEIRRRAALGEARAQLEFAWEYVRGDVIPKDLNAAIAILRQMETNAPELARFNIAKIKLLENDDSGLDELEKDCKKGFGPACYLMGVYAKQRKGDLERAIVYWRAGADSGHLPSEYLVWRSGQMSLWRRITTVIPAHRLFIRLLGLRWRNVDDIRILT